LGTNIVEDRHDHSLREIPIPVMPLSVFFIDRYSILG